MHVFDIMKQLNELSCFYLLRSYSLIKSYFLQDFIREVDPDIIIGYNICKFDLPYLIEVLI